MANNANKELLESLLADAMEMLGEMRNKMALFENQHYWKLKHKYDQWKALPEPLLKKLNEIETEC